MTVRPIRRALLSLADKTGLVDFARALAERNVELVSTGGTARTLRDGGLDVVDVAGITGFPEILGGRVKTLHPKIHGALLATGSAEHEATLAAHAIPRIDLLVVDLYPFAATRASGASFADCIEQIDVGGPAMIRAAAKNHDMVAVLVDPTDRAGLLGELDAAGGTSLETRRRLAAKAFALTASYDAEIAGFLAEIAGELFPERLVLAGSRLERLRYGENPHQEAALYRLSSPRPGVATARRLQGKELSYNNLLDADAALEAVAEHSEPAVVIVKHANPCGVAVGPSLRSAWEKALASDPVSAFGGIVAVNRPLDAATAEAMAALFLEVIVAPAVEPEAAELLARKPGLRVLLPEGLPDPAAPGLVVRSLAGALLVQTRDPGVDERASWKVPTRRAPSEAEWADLVFAWKVVRHVRSNAIVLARSRATVGIGMGETSRVDAVHHAVERMRRGPGPGPCVVASDAFFPFADGLEAAIAGGATAAIQPGGSKRDAEVIAAADRAGLAMVFTGRRHFRH
ncbi:MAG: bifunctional phosphoribosylaminoimidazolecarboxamide formyltransferase/IMP cyclohydrolase [Geminicoccaceae bacterium]|nr:bifunctional phosphoribosylaminoimidazolecarboxamide formyltransferase/IMP cyclohydrolase [Geminicoccaceae bacterium]MDW8369737.1 bifunctional phosphoribosylaminoimidazolecarboxamide formyltransferase/IMP cyclohydrolase [Geminicoccaceae bacterium]